MSVAIFFLRAQQKRNEQFVHLYAICARSPIVRYIIIVLFLFIVSCATGLIIQPNLWATTYVRVARTTVHIIFRLSKCHQFI